MEGNFCAFKKKGYGSSMECYSALMLAQNLLLPTLLTCTKYLSLIVFGSIFDVTIEERLSESQDDKSLEKQVVGNKWVEMARNS